MAIKLGEIIPQMCQIIQLNQWVMNKSGPTNYSIKSMGYE